MWEWLFASVDPDRVHSVTSAMSWHGRLMVFAWGFLSPVAILIARFAKILPWQKWPKELDTQTWWNSHWSAQTCAIMLTIFATGLIMFDTGNSGNFLAHQILGYAILTCGFFQAISGIFRGSKGGPTAPAKDGSWHGDHYDMTKWRCRFETLHKTVGYSTIAIAFMTVPTGMWAANAPNWMFVSLFTWWSVLITAFIILQKRGCAIETYQAIWGPDPTHPGNKKPPVGWAVRRPADPLEPGAGE